MLTSLAGKEEIDTEQTRLPQTNVSQLAPKVQSLDDSPQSLEDFAPSRCDEKDICWSFTLTFRELVAPRGAVFVCVCLSLLKFTLSERGENRPPEALPNSFGRPRTASRGPRVFSACMWLRRPTADVS